MPEPEEAIITALIDEREEQEATKRTLPEDKRVTLANRLEAARASIKDANEKNEDVTSTVDELLQLVNDAAENLFEAAELLEELVEEAR